MREDFGPDAAVHVVVVAYHAAKQLRMCLDGLGGEFPVTVVDNSCDDEVRAAAEATGADYLDAGRNRGFGAGVNLALRSLDPAEGGDVLLLNPDAVLSADGVRALARALHAEGWEQVCAVSPELRSPDGDVQRVMWPFPAPWRAWVEACGLGRLNRSRDFSVGAVLLLRREAIAQVGPFDERFFLYAEEVDWQRRARQLGWRAAAIDSVEARHVGGGTSADPPRREELFHAAGETYIRKWFGRRGWASYRLAVLLGAAVRSVLLPGRRRVQAAARARIYWTGPRRAAGWEAG